ncbi:MAG: hypothetical protein ACTHLD_18245, partial [Chitinophaga sp.]
MNGFSPWYAAVYQALGSGALQTLYSYSLHGYAISAQLTDNALWLVITWPKGGSMAVRTAYAPDAAMQLTAIETAETGVLFRLESPMGRHIVALQYEAGSSPLFHCSVRFIPAHPFIFPFWPRDLVMLGKSALPEGRVHISQKGHRSGLLYFSLTKPVIGSVLYFQHLGSLKDYNEDKQNEASDAVGGQLQEIGFSLPPGELPLKAGKEYVVSDATLLFTGTVPKSEF